MPQLAGPLLALALVVAAAACLPFAAAGKQAALPPRLLLLRHRMAWHVWSLNTCLLSGAAAECGPAANNAKCGVGECCSIYVSTRRCGREC